MSDRFDKVTKNFAGIGGEIYHYPDVEVFGSAPISDEMIQIASKGAKATTQDLAIQTLAEAINILDKRVKDLEAKDLPFPSSKIYI